VQELFRQSMAYQVSARWEAAPAAVAAVICFASLVGLPCSLVPKDQREVCPLSRGMAGCPLHPYPLYYRAAFACSLLLYPPSYQLALRVAFHEGRTTGLPCSTQATGMG